MANTIKIIILRCDNKLSLQTIVDDPLSAITSGGTYFFNFNNPTIESNCFTVVSVPKIDGSPAEATFTGPYTDCIDCLSINSPYVTLSNCDGSQGLYTFNVSDFTSGITTGDTFYMNFTWNGKRLVGCYYIVDFSFTPPIELSTLNETPISELSCTDCLINNSNILYLTSCVFPVDLYPFNIGDLPSGTTTGDTFYIDFTYFGKQLNGCFYVADFGFDIPREISVLINQSGQTDCATCYAENPFVYVVIPCVGFDSVEWFHLIATHSKSKAAGAGATGMPTQIADQNVLQIGAWKAVDCSIVIFDLSHVNEALLQQKTKPIQGIIGADVLLKGKGIIDYANQYLYLK